ncbi:hypothetical protein [Pseudonocardia sp.]|uniref:hypothetical protein n=1 Tax=Pseudonocardia sp. TaxID=60912 RepID=UPI003D105BAA
MVRPGDRPLLQSLARSLFPPGSFPEDVYARAADEVLHHGWVRQLLRRDASRYGGPEAPHPVGWAPDLDPVEEVVAQFAESAHGTPLLEVISDAAVRAALDAARTERVAAGRLARPA